MLFEYENNFSMFYYFEDYGQWKSVKFILNHPVFKILTNYLSSPFPFQFRTKPPKVPWKSIVVAMIMFVMGTTLLIIGALLVSGHISTQYSDRLWPVIFLGVILFVPGFYHVRLALYAYKGYPGYSFDDIPDYDD